MSYYKIFLLALLICTCSIAKAAKVDTVVTYSACMQKEIKATVVTPNSYSASKALPVVYLLHGYGGDYSNWLKRNTGIEALADQHELIIVCPDGANSWYFDSPVDKSSQYETYITKELVGWVDKSYSTIQKKEGRAITGISMGGHGALYLAFRHQDIFGAAGSISGGLDFRPFPTSWDIAKRLGSYAEHPERWESSTVINMLHLLVPNALAIIVDCGAEDIFYDVNCRFHKKMLDRKIPHDFISRPGKHDWVYWANAIQYQLLFMKTYFAKQNAAK